MSENKDDSNIIELATKLQQVRRKRRKLRADPEPAHSRGGAPPGKWTPNELGLPTEDACPVEPLGFEQDRFYLIDARQQFRAIRSWEFTQVGIQDLFSPFVNYPKWAWPRYGRGDPPPIKSFEADGVKEALFKACADRGLFEPGNRLRGRGAWMLTNGRLVFHAGDELWTCDPDTGKFRDIPTGIIGEHLYPRLAALPTPIPHELTAGTLERTVGALLETLRSWQWERPRVDPVLLLGWLGVAFLGGALDWRSALLLLGDFGTGKSSLHELLKALFGALLFHSADTTAAAIYQSLRYDSRPVAVDELEPDADGRKVANVVQLMRDASSGAMGRRGSSDGIAAEFQMRSAFLFSAINNPITTPQDLSRIAILRLRPLGDAKPPPAIDADICGRVILTRMMLEWHRFRALFDAFGLALSAGGHKGRGRDTYGTLLACAEMLLGRELGEKLGVPLSDDAGFWSEHLSAEKLAEVEDAMANWLGCITHMLTWQVPQWRLGARATVGQLIDELVKGTIELGDARRELGLAGFGISRGEYAPLDAGYVLHVPNSGDHMMKVFEKTQWAGGAWRDALRQAPYEVVIPGVPQNRVRIGGVPLRCTFIVLQQVIT